MSLKTYSQLSTMLLFPKSFLQNYMIKKNAIIGGQAHIISTILHFQKNQILNIQIQISPITIEI